MKLRRNNFEIKWCEFTYSDQTTLIADPKLSLDAKRQKKKLNSHVFWCFYHAKETKKKLKIPPYTISAFIFLRHKQ